MADSNTETKPDTGTGSEGAGEKGPTREALLAQAKDERGKRQALEARLKEVEGKLTEREAAERTAEETRLKENNEHKTLAERYKADADKFKADLDKMRRTSERTLVKAKAMVSAGADFDERYIDALFPFDMVKVKDGGALDGFDDAMQQFRTENPKLFSAPASVKGAAANASPFGSRTPGAVVPQFNPAGGNPPQQPQPADRKERQAAMVDALKRAFGGA